MEPQTLTPKSLQPLYDPVNFRGHFEMLKKMVRQIPSIIIRLFLVILFIAHVVVSILILFKLDEIQQFKLYIANIICFIFPFIIIYMIVTTYIFIYDHHYIKLNPSTPFVLLILCLTSFNVDLEPDGIDFCCNNNNNIFIKCLNYIITAILFTIFAVFTPFIFILWCINPSNQDWRGTMFIVSVSYPIFVMFLNTIIHLIALSIATDLFFVNEGITMILIAISIFIFYLLTLLSGRRLTRLLFILFSAEVLQLFIMISVTITLCYKYAYIDHDLIKYLSIIMCCNFIFPNIPFLKTMRIYQFHQLELKYFNFIDSNFSELKANINEINYCYLHLAALHPVSRSIYNERTELLVDKRRDIMDDNKLYHNKNDIKCFLIHYNFINMTFNEQLKYLNILSLNYNKNVIKTNNMYILLKTWIYRISSFLAIIFPIGWIFYIIRPIHVNKMDICHISIKALTNCHIIHESIKNIRLFLVAIEVVYVLYLFALMFRYFFGSYRYWNIITTSVNIQKNNIVNIKDVKESMETIVYTQAIKDFMNTKIRLIILSYLFEHTA